MLDRITTCKILEIRSQEQISFYTHTDTHRSFIFCWNYVWFKGNKIIPATDQFTKLWNLKTPNVISAQLFTLNQLFSKDIWLCEPKILHFIVWRSWMMEPLPDLHHNWPHPHHPTPKANWRKANFCQKEGQPPTQAGPCVNLASPRPPHHHLQTREQGGGVLSGSEQIREDNEWTVRALPADTKESFLTISSSSSSSSAGGVAEEMPGERTWSPSCSWIPPATLGEHWSMRTFRGESTDSTDSHKYNS